MSGDEIRRLLGRLSQQGRPVDGSAFSALPVPTSGGHMVALSAQERPALLLRTVMEGHRPDNIHLSGVSAVFGVPCTVGVGGAPAQDYRVSVLECTAGVEAIPMFAEAAVILLRLLGPAPTMVATAMAIARFAAIFSALSRPSSQSVTGLIGELMLLLMASDPAQAITCWRLSATDRFDFMGWDARVEAKAFSSSLRLHSFSWEQCNPPDGRSLVASLRVEAAGGGTSVGGLLDRIEDRLSGAPDAAARLRETVASTMGRSLPQALRVTFDEPLCRASLEWFQLNDVPAIRGDLPVGVGALRFASDVSLTRPVSPVLLCGTSLACLVPAQPKSNLRLSEGTVG